MEIRNNVGGLAVLAGITAVFVGGCGGIIDPTAKEALFQGLGNTSFTVFPAFVRGEDTSYDETAAAQIGEFLMADGLAEVTLSSQEVPITGSWGMNQAKMLRESAEAFAAYVSENPIQTEYALLAEYLIGGRGLPVGIHCYVLDTEGGVAHAVLLNSHWDAFATADPKTVEDCTAVLVEVLREDFS